jgi:hypothetical protein
MPLFSSSFKLGAGQAPSSQQFGRSPDAPTGEHTGQHASTVQRTYNPVYPPESESPFHDEEEDGFDFQQVGTQDSRGLRGEEQPEVCFAIGPVR